jgi:hypothetical protein
MSNENNPDTGSRVRPRYSCFAGSNLNITSWRPHITGQVENTDKALIQNGWTTVSYPLFKKATAIELTFSCYLVKCQEGRFYKLLTAGLPAAKTVDIFT